MYLVFIIKNLLFQCHKYAKLTSNLGKASPTGKRFRF